MVKTAYFARSLAKLHNHKCTQPFVQLQHRLAVRTRISPPPFIPQQNAEMDHVTLGWNHHTFSHHALLMWCTALKHWDKFCVTTNFRFLLQQSRTVAKRLLLKGPTLGCRCFLWCQYRQQGFFQAMCEWHFQLQHCMVENKLLKWIFWMFLIVKQWHYIIFSVPQASPR